MSFNPVHNTFLTRQLVHVVFYHYDFISSLVRAKRKFLIVALPAASPTKIYLIHNLQ